MANLNKVMLAGRLTRDPEYRVFANGGAVVAFGLAVNERRKNKDGSWGDIATFLDVKAYNRGKLKQADTINRTLKRGAAIFVEGKLVMESWTDKATGSKRNKLLVVIENFQYLDAKPGAPTNGATSQSRPPSTATTQPQSDADEALAGSYAGNEDEIPF